MSPASRADVLSALGDDNRLRIVEAVGSGRTTPTALSTELGLTRQAVSKHLGVLAAAGVVDAQRQGREVHYAVRNDVLANTGVWLQKRAAQWDRRLGRLRTLVEGGTPEK